MLSGDWMATASSKFVKGLLRKDGGFAISTNMVNLNWHNIGSIDLEHSGTYPCLYRTFVKICWKLIRLNLTQNTSEAFNNHHTTSRTSIWISFSWQSWIWIETGLVKIVWVSCCFSEVYGLAKEGRSDSPLYSSSAYILELFAKVLSVKEHSKWIWQSKVGFLIQLQIDGVLNSSSYVLAF